MASLLLLIILEAFDIGKIGLWIGSNYAVFRYQLPTSP